MWKNVDLGAKSSNSFPNSYHKYGGQVKVVITLFIKSNTS